MPGIAHAAVLAEPGTRLVGTGSASAVWLTLGTLCGLVGVTTVRRRRTKALS